MFPFWGPKFFIKIKTSIFKKGDLGPGLLGILQILSVAAKA